MPDYLREGRDMSIVSPKDALSSFFTKAFDYRTRATRAEFWIPYFLFTIILQFLGGVISTYTSGSPAGPIFLLVISIGIWVPGLSLFVRRLHDIGLSGWWMLVYPAAGIISVGVTVLGLGDGTLLGVMILLAVFFLIAGVTPSNKADNKYGPSRRVANSGSGDDLSKDVQKKPITDK